MALSRCRVMAFPPALGALLIAVGLAGALANAQSFDCGKARYADEKTICRDRALGRLDQELASVYRRLMLKLPKRESEQLDKDEDAFVLTRRRCGHHRDCIERSYRNRIRQLEEALPKDDPSSRLEGRDLGCLNPARSVCLWVMGKAAG